CRPSRAIVHDARQRGIRRCLPIYLNRPGNGSIMSDPCKLLRGHMFNGDQTRNAMRPLLLLACAALASVPLFSQGGPARAANPPDISGEWRLENSEDDTTVQPPLGDYTGIPFNDAGRLRSDTTPESIWGTPEYQCRPHSAPHQWRGLGGARILKEQDPLTRDTRAYHVQFMRSLDRPIFMDG